MKNTLLSLFLLLLTSCTTIAPGERGVSVLWGTANPDLLEPGFHTTGFATVEEVSVKEKPFEITGSGFTIDNQEVDFTMTVVTKLQPAGVFPFVTEHPELFTGTLVPAAVSSAKEAMKAKDIWEVNTNRESVASDTLDILQEAMNPYSLTIISIEFTDMEPDADFMASVREKQQAEVRKAQAEEELARKTTDAQIVIAEADANAKAKRLQADAEAYAISTTGEALRKNPQVLDLQRIETWNGIMPTTLITNGGNSTLLVGSGGN